jgi:type IV secretory pathway TrbL component
MGWIAVFENLVQILCLFFAWALVILAFFILAIQLFVTLIEFKLMTLAGFVLIPFGLFGKTAYSRLSHQVFCSTSCVSSESFIVTSRLISLMEIHPSTSPRSGSCS